MARGISRDESQGLCNSSEAAGEVQSLVATKVAENMAGKISELEATAVLAW